MILFLLIVALAAGIYASVQMRPILERMAVSRVSNTVNRIVSEAVKESIASGKISYDRMISFEKDTEGRITAVHSNMAAFNQLQAEILDIVLRQPFRFASSGGPRSPDPGADGIHWFLLCPVPEPV